MFKIKITNNLYNYKVTDSCLMKLFNDNAFNKFEMIWTKHKSADINWSPVAAHCIFYYAY